jgi:hypothetical protein
MAETMFGNMFDVTTSENQNIRDRALKVAQLQPGRASVYGAGVAGGMLMQNLASMAGMKTPEQEKTELISGIMDRATNLDPNDPSSYMKLANDFVQAGLPGIGQKFMDKSRSVQVQNTTSAQADRELDQRDTRLDFDKNKLTADTSYRDKSLSFSQQDLEFRTEKEETRIEELKAQLERDQKVGALQQITDSQGNTILAQITTDDEGNYSVKPITQDVVESSMSGSATQGAETTTQSGKFSFNNQGALIVKPAETEDVAPIEEIDDDANTIYDNLLKEYKTTFIDRNAPMMSTGSQLAVPATGEFSSLESVPDPIDYMIYKTIEKIENRGGVVDSMYDLYMGPGAEAMEALMKGNGMANLWAENKARFEKEGDTTLYSMEGRQTLIDGTLKGIITSPIAFDVKLKQDHTTEDGTMLAKKGETFDDVMSRLMSQDITAVTRDDEGNITGFQPPEKSAFFNFNDDLVRYIAQDIVSKEEGFKGLPEITGTADTSLPEIDYGNQNVLNNQVTAELVNVGANNTPVTETVMGDTTEFNNVVKENGNIVADVAKDIKRFVLDIFKPKEHKDSAPENPIKSGFGSDAWSLRLLSVKVSQFDTAKKNADGKYELEMPMFIEVKDAKIRQAYQEWKARNFNYFFRQGITLPNARVMPK